MDWVQCFWCGKKYLKDIRHINENKKFGHKSYCSFNCQILAKSKKVEFICRNPVCQNRFNRQPKDISPNNFCSRSCAVSIYKPTRKFFGTWNNAIEAAGFDQNPVLFAKHQIANDGHICDSIAEKLIDDYLFDKSS